MVISLNCIKKKSKLITSWLGTLITKLSVLKKPHELASDWPVDLPDGKTGRTGTLWQILDASFVGDLSTVRSIVEQCPQMAYAQFNYTPPIYFAAREGHVNLVDYLLQKGAWDPNFRSCF